MKELFVKYKSVVVFLVLFLGCYFILSLLYSGYLTFSEGSAYQPDYVTHLVARQSTLVIESFGYKAQVIPNISQPSMQLFVEDLFLARIVEGCNALSVIILFVSFVIAFAQSAKRTILFLLTGIVLIYAINIVRIAVLAIALYHFPEYEHLLHGVIFPAFIYGIVFLLWVAWVRMLTPIPTSK